MVKVWRRTLVCARRNAPKVIDHKAGRRSHEAKLPGRKTACPQISLNIDAIFGSKHCSLVVHASCLLYTSPSPRDS